MGSIWRGLHGSAEKHRSSQPREPLLVVIKLQADRFNPTKGALSFADDPLTDGKANRSLSDLIPL